MVCVAPGRNRLEHVRTNDPTSTGDAGPADFTGTRHDRGKVAKHPRCVGTHLKNAPKQRSMAAADIDDRVENGEVLGVQNRWQVKPACARHPCVEACVPPSLPRA